MSNNDNRKKRMLNGKEVNEDLYQFEMGNELGAEIENEKNQCLDNRKNNCRQSNQRTHDQQNQQNRNKR